MNMQFNSTQELVAALAPIATPNSFAASLVASFNYWGDLTIRQKAAAERMLAPKETVNAGAIEALLGTAKDSGIKRPVFRADGLAFVSFTVHFPFLDFIVKRLFEVVKLGKLFTVKFVSHVFHKLFRHYVH